MMKPVIALIAGLLCNSFILPAQSARNMALPHVLVYKTKADYRDLVPVLLSKDKKQVISFPGPGDVKTGSGYALPVLLHKGYLLDKRGIGVNSAFLKLTYEEYSQLKELPSPAVMYDMIVDKNPLTTLYDCGIRENGENLVKELNKIIDKKQLGKKCKAMK